MKNKKYCKGVLSLFFSVLSSFLLGSSLGGIGYLLGGWLGWFLGIGLAIALLLIKFEILEKIKDEK